MTAPDKVNEQKQNIVCKSRFSGYAILAKYWCGPACFQLTNIFTLICQFTINIATLINIWTNISLWKSKFNREGNQKFIYFGSSCLSAIHRSFLKDAHCTSCLKIYTFQFRLCKAWKWNQLIREPFPAQIQIIRNENFQTKYTILDIYRIESQQTALSFIESINFSHMFASNSLTDNCRNPLLHSIRNTLWKSIYLQIVTPTIFVALVQQLVYKTYLDCNTVAGIIKICTNGKICTPCE